jgi:predicted aconitase
LATARELKCNLFGIFFKGRKLYMRLTKDEEKMLSGGYGEGYRKAMEILVKLGEYYDAECMVPISMAYLVLGTDSPDNELYKWIKEFVDLGVTFKCPLTIAFPGAPETIELDQRLGAQFTYGSGGSPTGLFPLPVYGQHVVPSNTNTTAFLNGIVGARANTEGPIGEYMAAIVGKTPKYGYHLPENRVGKVLFEVKAELKSYTDWNALGFYISKTLATNWWDVPVLSGIQLAATTLEDLISFCSTIPAYGNVTHFLIAGISPEARTLEEAFGGEKPKEKFVVGSKEIQEVYDRFSTKERKPDLVEIFMGGGLQNIYRIARMVEGKKVNKDVPLFVSMNTAERSIADRFGLTKILEEAGVQLGGITWKGQRVNLMRDAGRLGIKVVVSDSAKNCHYMPQQEVEMVLLPVEKCVKVALTGKLEV